MADCKQDDSEIVLRHLSLPFTSGFFHFKDVDIFRTFFQIKTFVKHFFRDEKISNTFPFISEMQTFLGFVVFIISLLTGSSTGLSCTKYIYYKQSSSPRSSNKTSCHLSQVVNKFKSDKIVSSLVAKRSPHYSRPELDSTFVLSVFSCIPRLSDTLG